ncbi:FAD-binding oxidoreductase [Microbacterium gorillae]|uniref:FAD-binding oxidoreductase n=1 Tax=Microbacterium gorillae TaxID=1231063 RepID=UPI00058C24C0|nr:FAD-binding oxidoreductase [Microbacterium gorillae]
MTNGLENFSGELVWPDSPRYDDARSVYNQRIDMRPALVARCRTTADVQIALRYARANDLEVAVRSAGNNYNGFSTSDGGVVIDLGAMTDVTISPEDATAWVGGGMTGGVLLKAAEPYGLAPVTGVMCETGLGLMLGGGFGHLRNRAGWSADQILGAELVTADGEIVRVGTEENPDLLWALRGAGANFGIVTALRLQLHTMPAEVVSGAMYWGEDRIAEGLRALRDVLAVASPDFSVAGWLKAADARAVVGGPPEHLAGKRCLEITYVHWGTPEDAATAVQALQDAGSPDAVVPMSVTYRGLHERWKGTGARMTWDGVSARTLSEPVIDLLVATTRESIIPGSRRCIELFDQRGALATEPTLPSSQPRALETAWSLRPGVSSVDPSMDEPNDRWALDFLAAVLDLEDGIPDACGLNSTSWVPDAERVRTHYGAGTARLVELKRTWDPENVFRKNQNIDPAWVV